MATRTIGTKLVMEGEAEYRASLSRISKELGTLDSALKLVESQYKGNANSMEALKAKGQTGCTETGIEQRQSRPGNIFFGSGPGQTKG